jgi:hypothetical protein
MERQNLLWLEILVTHFRLDTIKAYPFAMSLSKGEWVNRSSFDRLTTNGLTCPAVHY